MEDKESPTPMPADGPWLIQEVLSQLGWDADPTFVAARVRRLDIGLPAEDEFSAVCAWLGKCTILHKLDQVQVPASSKSTFQVPDLLARFSTQSTDRPVLIEVKSKTAQRLKLSGEYLAKLQAYASLVDMPLLIAWKFHGLWMLFEAKHLQKAKKNYFISVEDAMKQNLLSILAGDLGFVLGAGAGVHLRFRKDELVSTVPGEGIRTEQWFGHFDKLRYTDYNGNALDDVDVQLQGIFKCAELDEEFEHVPSHIWTHYVANEEVMCFGHRALVELLHWEHGTDGGPRWRGVIRREQITTHMTSLEDTLQKALARKIVRTVITQLPNAMPDFVSYHPRGEEA